MDTATKSAIFNILTRVPEWLRHDFASKDSAARIRAEESLAAILADSIAKRGHTET